MTQQRAQVLMPGLVMRKIEDPLQMMGGEIGVGSAPGQGGVFWLTVQLENGEAPVCGVNT